MKEDIAHLKVAVPIKDLWNVMTRDFRYIVPKILTHNVEEIELVEGDGGLGSIFLIKFTPNVPKVRYQKDKIVELDESLHQFAFEVVEGGRLEHKYSSYMTSYKLTEVAESETLIDMKVSYETKPEHTHIPGETLKITSYNIKCFENYLLNDPS